MYSVCKLKVWDVKGLLHVSNILYKCGKDMAQKYQLYHCDNSHVKNWVILALCIPKNNIYLVYDDKIPIATFQTKKINKSYLFQKLATSPEFGGKGIGTFCLEEIEKLAKSNNCKEIICEVYNKSEHAKAFYLHKGYEVYGKTETLKYTELKLKKSFEE